MKIRKILVIIAFLLGIGMLSSCSRNTALDECDNTSRSSYSFDAYIEIDGDTVGFDDVIKAKKTTITNKIVVKTSDDPFVVGMMVFNNGRPIPYRVKKQEYTYYTFTAGKNSKIELTIDTADLANGQSKVSIVLLTNEGYHPEFNRDDIKNYSMTMDYTIDNLSDSSNQVDEKAEPANIQHISLTEYFNVCKQKYIKTYPEMKSYDFSYEEQCLYDLTQNDLDIVFTEAFDLEENTALSVYRFASQYPNSNKSMYMRITGKPGTYQLSIFANGKKYAGFNGAETITFTLGEKEMLVVPVLLPPYSTESYTNVYALAFNTDMSEHRVYDSAVLTVYNTQTDVNFYYNHVQTYYNIIYENELLQDRTIYVQNKDMKFRFVMNQSVTSVYPTYTLLIMIDGVPHEYTVNGEKCTGYTVSCAEGVVDLEIEISPEMAALGEPFTIDFVPVQKYANNCFSTPNAQTTQQSKLSFECYHSDVSADDVEMEEGEGEQKPEISASLEINNGGLLPGNSVMCSVQDADEYMVSVTVTTTEKSILKHTLLVNDRIIVIDEQYEYTWLSDDTYSFVFAIPREYLDEGMNEIQLISTHGGVNISYQTVMLICRKSEAESGLASFKDDVVHVTPDENNLTSSLFVSSGVENCSHYIAMFRCTSARMIRSDATQTAIVQATLGKKIVDQRFVIKIITMTINCNDKEYHFTQQHYIGGTY